MQKDHGFERKAVMRRVQGKAKRQVYDIEVETSPYKPLEDQIPAIDHISQNPEILAVRCPAYVMSAYQVHQKVPLSQAHYSLHRPLSRISC